jgi:DNA-binding MarR family transcriptional regulator
MLTEENCADLSAAEYRALAEFRHRLARFLQHRRRAARAAGLQPLQYQLMLAVKGIPKHRHPNIGEIAEHLQVHPHTVVELVGRLERRQLIRRQRDRYDHRIVRLSLTPVAKPFCASWSA